MATFRKYLDQKGNVSWQVQVRKLGHVASKTFRLQEDAKRWATQTEDEIAKGIFNRHIESERTKFSEAIDRYRKERLPILKGGKPDASRLLNLEERLGHLPLAGITSATLAQYRDDRLREVSTQSVIHELNLIGRVLKCCVVDWGIQLPAGIPTVRKPTKPAGRNRRIEQGEIDAILDATGSVELRSIVLLALETAMRRTEIALARWEDVDLRRRTLRLWETKNGDSRVVPLSSAAIGMLEGLPRRLDGYLFGNESGSIGQAFERAVARARSIYLRDCESDGKQVDKNWLMGVRFHDLRHEATSRIAEKVSNIIELASITGHRDVQMLKRYYHPRAEDLAKKLG